MVVLDDQCAGAASWARARMSLYSRVKGAHETKSFCDGEAPSSIYAKRDLSKLEQAQELSAGRYEICYDANACSLL